MAELLSNSIVKLNGIELTNALKKLEKTSSEILIEVEEETVLPHLAKGYISIHSVCFDYQYHGDFLYLDAHDMEAHFDHTRQWDEHQFLVEEKEMKEKLEKIFSGSHCIKLISRVKRYLKSIYMLFFYIL